MIDLTNPLPVSCDDLLHLWFLRECELGKAHALTCAFVDLLTIAERQLALTPKQMQQRFDEAMQLYVDERGET